MRDPQNPFTKDKSPLKPGLYFGVRDEIYFNDPALSRSDILALEQFPGEYYLSSWMSPSRRLKKPTAAMLLGTAFHTLLLQPEAFKERYTVQPGESWGIGKIMVTKPDYEKMCECVAIIKRNPKISQLFMYGSPEVVMVWPDPETGVMLRSKADYMKSIGVVDYKTTSRGLSNDTLYWETINHGYHVQDVMYAEGFHVLREMIKNKTARVYGLCDLEFIKRYIGETDYLPVKFVWQLTNHPHAVVATEISDEDRQTAIGIKRMAISEYLRCLKTYGTDRDWMPQDEHIVLTRPNRR